MSVSDFNVEIAYDDGQRVLDSTTNLWKFRLPYPTSSGSDWLLDDIRCEIWNPAVGPRVIGSTSSEMVRVGNYLDIKPVDFDGTTTGWRITLYRRVDPSQNFSPSSLAGFDLAAMVEQQDRTLRLAQEAFAMARRGLQIHPKDVTPASGRDAPVAYYNQLTGTSTMTIYTSPAWSAANSYAVGDVVNYAGAIYISLASGNSGNTPTTSPIYWNNVTQKVNQWETTATYGAGDVVLYSGLFYQSLVPDNSGNSPSAQGAYWERLSQSIPDFDVASTYAANEVVNYGGVLWRATTSVAASATVPADSLTNWTRAVNIIPTYAAGTTYAANDFVAYTGKLYLSLQGSNVGNTPSASGSTYWREYSSGSTGGAGAYHFDGAESGAAGWTGFDDGVLTAPVDGDGGTATGLTMALETAAPLAGLASYKLSKDTSNRKGKGYRSIVTGYTIPRGAIGETLQLKMRYKTSDTSGTAYADGDFGVWLYDINAATLVTLSNNSLNRSTTASWFTASFTPVSTAADGYRIILFCTSTTTGAFDIIFDDVQIAQYQQYVGAAIGAWQSYTPTFTGFGTVSVQNFKYRRVAENIEIKGSFTLGTPTAVEAQVTLPTGIVSDANVPTISICGSASGSVATTTVMAPAIEPSKAYFVFTRQAGSISGTAKLNGNSGLGSAADTLSVNVSVPVSGWVTNVALATDFTEYAANSQAVVNTNDTSSFYYLPEGAAILSNTAATYYDVSFRKPFSQSDLFAVEVRSKIDGSWVNVEHAAVPSLFVNLKGMPTFAASARICGVFAAKVTAQIVRVYFGIDCVGMNSFGAGASATARAWSAITGAADGFDRWRVRKISNGNFAEQPGLVRAVCDSATVSIGTTQVIVQFDTVTEDTHYRVTTGAAWKFTAPHSGVYQVELSPLGDGVAGGTGAIHLVGIHKNNQTMSAWNADFDTIFTQVIDANRPTVSAVFGLGGASTIRLAAGDYITISGVTQATTSTFPRMRAIITRIGA